MKMEMDPQITSEAAPKKEPSAWILILLGLALIGYFVLWPIWQVQHGAPEITFTGELGFAGILLFFIGIARLIAPQATLALAKMDMQNLKKKDVVLLVLTAILAIACAAGMEYYFNLMGYH